MLKASSNPSENLFKDIEGKVDSSKVEPVQALVEELKKLMGLPQKDVVAIKAKLEEIQKKVQELSIEMYQKVAQEQAAQADAAKAGTGHEHESKTKDGENVVDADFEEVKEEKDGKKDEKESKAKRGKK